MTYLLDTDTVSTALRGIGGVGDRLRATAPEAVAVASITEAELWYGLEKRKSRRLRNAVTAFLQPLCILPFDSDAARQYGRLQAQLEAAGTPVGMADVMIAAVALMTKRVLVTNNGAHFGRIRQLQWESWA
ncbi:MAG: type II toxin-antitoxin system VapC family toxin [Planctomycetota bacterium]